MRRETSCTLAAQPHPGRLGKPLAPGGSSPTVSQRKCCVEATSPSLLPPSRCTGLRLTPRQRKPRHLARFGRGSRRRPRSETRLSETCSHGFVAPCVATGSDCASSSDVNGSSSSTATCDPDNVAVRPAYADAFRWKLAQVAVDASPAERLLRKRGVRQRLCDAQPALRQGPRYELPVPPKDPAMKPVMQVINAAYARRPTNEVPFGETTNVAEVVGHFWRPEDLHGLPAELREILQETYEAEEQEIQYVKSHGHSSGKLLQADNARHLGLPQATVDAWRDGSELTLNAEPQSYYRRPYSSVYDSLDTLMQVCRETLRLIKLGKAMPWLKKPLIVSPTAMIVKPSSFEPDGWKRRICYDKSISGLNDIIDIPPSKLPTIFTLLESMGPGYFMGKSDLKDMFFNFPLHPSYWTLMGFSHPVTGQYMVLPFFPFGLKNAPGDCQRFAEQVRDVIQSEADARMNSEPSHPLLASVPRQEEGLGTALSPAEAASHVYIDDFQYLTQLLQQGLEIFEIGAKVFELLGLIEKVVKREGPARVMALLGFQFDSVTGRLQIPHAKCKEILELLEGVLAASATRSAVPFSVLLSLVGKLTWASTGIELGRSFLAGARAPLDAVSSMLTTPAGRRAFLIPVHEYAEMLLNLTWWREALVANDGAVTVHTGTSGLFERWNWDSPFGAEVPADVVQIFSDACPQGGGWCWGAERRAFTWTRKERRHHINILEAFTILKFLQSEASAISGTRVLHWCDNMVSVRALRKGNSSSAVLKALIRQIRLICVSFDIQYCVAHIAGVDNVMADALSRGMISSRCSSWSFNGFIMARWKAYVGGFDMDAFCDPSGRGSQGSSYCHVNNAPFSADMAGRAVWAFPPLDLISEFLSAYPTWNCRVLLAALPMSVVQSESFSGHLLHCYKSHKGLFIKPSGIGSVLCPAMGFDMGVFAM